MRLATLTLALLSVLCTRFEAFAARTEERKLVSRGVERTYSLFVPDGLDRDAPAALLIALHGSGRNGSTIVNPWKKFATESKFIVAGPDSFDSSKWISPDDGPQFLYDLVEELKKDHAVDPRRVYLFGHSGGASFALQIALLESEYFAAVAVHAGALQPAAYPLVTYATRKVPFWIAIGTNDPFFPLASVRETRDEMVKHGLPVEVVEIKKHTHDYYGRSDSINRAAWTFLSAHALASEQRFTRYSNMQ